MSYLRNFSLSCNKLAHNVSRLSLIPIICLSFVSTNSYAGTTQHSVDTLLIKRAELKAIINDVIDQKVSEFSSDITGATIAIQFDGEPLLTRAIGYTNANLGLHVDERTGFRIGSISKLFAALSIMQLAEQGALSLDDSIFKHLPNYQPKLLPGVKADNRIRDLLTHHNGIPSLWLKGFEPVEGQTPLEAMREIPEDLSQNYLVENRRNVHAYTNVAYALLGLIVENVSGMAYDDYLKVHFFDKYGMHDAHTYLPLDAQNMALPHENQEAYESVQIPMVSAGSVVASANDMHVFSQLLLDTWHGENTGFLSARSLRKMSKFRHKGVKYDASKFMGLGFLIDKSLGFKTLGHGGAIETFISSFELVPSLNFALFVSSNEKNSEAFPNELRTEILNTLSALMTRRTSFTLEDSMLENATVTETSSEAHSLEHKKLPYTGYFILNGALLEFIQGDQQASLKISDNLYPLSPVESNKWQSEALGITLKAVHRFQGYDLGTPIVPIVSQLRDEVWDQRLGQIFTSTEKLSGKEQTIAASLEYDDSAKAYYLQTIVNGELEHLYVKIVNNQILQVQGAGRGAGVVIEFTDQDKQLHYAGITLKTLEVLPEVMASQTDQSI